MASSALRCYSSGGAAARRSVPTRSAGFLLRCDKRDNGVGLKLRCAAPAAWTYTHNSDSDSEPLPPLPWWGEELDKEDGEFFPLADFFPVGQGKKELDAIWRALVTGPLESIVLTLREIMAAGNFFRCRSFHAGTLSGALLVIAGFCQLCKTTPTLFMDIVLGYTFYKLSVLSGELQRDGRSFSICARIQLVLLLILSFKDNSAIQGFYCFLVELIWSFNIYMYFTMAYDGAVGMKHSRAYWLGVYKLLRTKGGLMKVVRFTLLDMFGRNKMPVSKRRRNKRCQ